MKWSDIGKKAAAIGLPSLGGALAGPAGAVIGAKVAERLGLPGANPEAVSRALDDPEAVVKLREIEADAEVKLAALEVQDRQDARSNVRDDRMRRILAMFLPAAALIFGASLVVALIHANEITQAVGIAGTILGWLIRDASAATSFFFGTSVGSARRAEELSQRRK